MRETVCAYCKKKFRPFHRHPDQRACSSAECQRRRRAEYHRKKLATDSVYREQCRDSRKKWRDINSDHIKSYMKGYRARRRGQRSSHADRSRLLNELRRLHDLVKNRVALELRSFGANILLVGPGNLPSETLKRHLQWQLQLIWWRVRARGPCLAMIKKGRECCGLRWSEADDRTLLNLTGYTKSRVIAEFLHRSKRAVWYRLTALARKLVNSSSEYNPTRRTT
jgi:hypothetical protein